MLPPELTTFFLAMTPVGELRVAIPVALHFYQLPVWEAYLFAVLGNMVPAIFLFWFLKELTKRVSFSSFLGSFLERFFKRTREKHFKKIEKWQEFALFLFVAIPLPFTGVITASLVAFVFGIPFKKAFPPIAAGTFVAGFIVSLSTLGVKKFIL